MRRLALCSGRFSGPYIVFGSGSTFALEGEGLNKGELLSKSSTQPEVVKFSAVDRIAVLTINRPEARNAINGDVARSIEESIDRLEDDECFRVGVLTGVPPVFCAGGDLKEVRADVDRRTTERGGFAGIVTRKRSKPIIAAVEGAALAGGLEICLSCDVIVASADASFGLPEVTHGLLAGSGGLFRLPRKLPLNVAMEMALTGTPIAADRAHQLGLVNWLTAPGEALGRSLQIAGQISRNAPLAVQESRRVMLHSLQDEEEAAWLRSASALADILATKDAREGLAAFSEKRRPNWTAE
jgi:enoyl-CoA hydratase